MNSEQQDMCVIASMNARALEEIMLSYDDVINLEPDEVEDVVKRCEQIIRCMEKCFYDDDRGATNE